MYLRNRGQSSRAAPRRSRVCYPSLTAVFTPKRYLQPIKEEKKTSLFVHHSTDPQSDVARARSWAAIYVQDFDAPCVLQFAWISALCCALHRSTSLVIHRSGSYKNDILRFVSFLRSLDRVKRKIEREVKKMFRLTRVLDWFCLDEREKRARSAIGRKRFKSPSLEAPDTRSLVVHRLSCSELSF